MKKMMDGTWMMDKWVDLNYSPDEDIYYFQDFENDKTSKSYKNKSEALKAYRTNSIEWEIK